MDQNHPGFPPGNLLLVVQAEVGGVAQAHLFPPIDWNGSVTNGTKYLRSNLAHSMCDSTSHTVNYLSNLPH